MIRDVHPRSRIRILIFTHPGSRIRGSKRHRIGIRIRNTDHIDIFFNCFIVFYYKEKNLKKKKKINYLMFAKPGVKIIYQVLLDSQ
jgi:hypothetical protein